MPTSKPDSPKAANPAGNRLRKGAEEEALLAAVTRSGYPLETIVAARLKKRRFYIEEEWPYTDSDSGEERTLDLHAGRQLAKLNTTERGRVGVYLNLLIECKASDLPFVAFESVEPPRPREYPSLTGLPRSRIAVYRDAGGNRFRETPVQTLLGFATETFIKTPPVASSLSRAERKGKNLELSGEQPFRALALPLTKALAFHRRTHAASKGQRDWWWAHPAVAIAVVDAPLTLARTPSEKPTVRAVPWVRLVRRHAPDPDDRWGGSRAISMLEIVHRDFFDKFMDDFLTPFAQTISKKLLRYQDILIAGKAVVPNLDFDKPGLPGIARIKPFEGS